jgi:hypothetical protein
MGEVTKLVVVSEDDSYTVAGFFTARSLQSQASHGRGHQACRRI